MSDWNQGKQKPKLPLRLAAVTAAAALAAADQLAKNAAAQHLPRTGMRTLVPGVLGLRFTVNTGISFSMFGGSQAAMAAVTVLTGIVMLAGIFAILLGKLRGAAWLGGAPLILAGGIGNWLDRAFQGYVVDYFEFLFVRFAVFNLADVFITCGVVWLSFWLIVEDARKKKKTL